MLELVCPTCAAKDGLTVTPLPGGYSRIACGRCGGTWTRDPQGRRELTEGPKRGTLLG